MNNIPSKKIDFRKLKLIARRLSKENKEKEGYLQAWVKPEELELIVLIEMKSLDPKKIMNLIKQIGKGGKGRKGKGSIKEVVLKIAEVEGIESAEKYLLDLRRQGEISVPYFRELRKLLREQFALNYQ